MKVLIISNFLPYPPIRGDFRRATHLIEWLKKSGHDLSYLWIQTDYTDRTGLLELGKSCDEILMVDLRPFFSRLQQGIGAWGRRLLSRFSIGRRYLKSRSLKQARNGIITKPGSVNFLNCASDRIKIEKVIGKMVQRPDVVICEYAMTARCLDFPQFSDVLKILDTIDVLHNRQTLAQKGVNPWVYCTREEEKGYLERADVILAMRPEEENFLRLLVPDRKVICAGHAFYVNSVPQTSNETSCLFIGSSQAENREGLSWFQSNVWPLVLRKIPSAKFLVAGEITTFANEEKSVELLENTAEVDPIYRRAAVVVVPVFSGTGLSTKFSEALSKGKAIVAVTHAARGITADDLYLCRDDAAGFAQATVRLLKDAALRKHFEENAIRYAQEYLQPDKAFAVLEEILITREPKSEEYLQPV